MTMTIKAAKEFGVVTKGNSKIHGSSYSLSPFKCAAGQKMRESKNKDMICKSCYAIKLSKVYPSALKSWERNQSLFEFALNGGDIQGWIEAIAHQINNEAKRKAKKGEKGSGLHRWFTSGDLPSVDALRAIVKVCELTPNVKHWMPTRERSIVSKYLNALGHIPANLNIRLSDATIDQGKAGNIDGCTNSSVHRDKEAKGMECNAYKTNGECQNCTACWSKEVKNVSYKVH